MKPRGIVRVATVLVIFLCLSMIIQGTAALSTSKHVMCRDVDKSESPWKPVGVADAFSTSEEKIFMFLELRDVAAHTAPENIWVAPDGTDSKGYKWKAYDEKYSAIRYYETFEIAGKDRLVGIWKSKIYVGDTLISTIEFKLQPAVELVSKSFNPKEGEPVFPGDVVTATYELKNTGKTAYKGVKFTMRTLPDGVRLTQATSEKDMKPDATEKFILKIKFEKDGTYDLKIQLFINDVLIEESTLTVKVSPVPFWQNPIMIGAIAAVVAVAVAAALILMKRKRGPAPVVPAAPAYAPVATKYCISCGASIPANAKYCRKCGSVQQ